MQRLDLIVAAIKPSACKAVLVVSASRKPVSSRLHLMIMGEENYLRAAVRKTSVAARMGW